MLEKMFQNLPTLGIRESHCRRHALRRTIETMDTSFGTIHVKKSEGYHVKREKIEYEDLARIAKERHLSIEEVREKVKEELK